MYNKKVEQPRLRKIETATYKCSCGAEIQHIIDSGSAPDTVKCWKCKNKVEKKVKKYLARRKQ